MTKMIAQCTQQGKTVDQAMDWAASELEGFSRVGRPALPAAALMARAVAALWAGTGLLCQTRRLMLTAHPR